MSGGGQYRVLRAFLTGPWTVGNHDFQTIALPAGVLVDDIVLVNQGIVSAGGGFLVPSAGSASGTQTMISNGGLSILTTDPVGKVYGHNTVNKGTDFPGNQNYKANYTAATSVWVRLTAMVATVTSGTILVVAAFKEL